MKPRTRSLILVAIIAAALAGLGLLYAYTHRSRTVKAYYRLERSWADRPRFQRAEKALERLEPFLCRVGLLGPARIQVQPNISYLLDPRDLVPLTILRTGDWQPEVWDATASSLSEGSVYFDVGAHIGYFTMKAAAQVGKTGRVVAFEPNPETLLLLRDNVKANHFDNVIVEPIACTDHDQTLTLYAASIANTGASSLARDNATISAEAPRAFTVRGRPIDDVVRELGLTRVDAIKIDVEGAEVGVLRGALNTLKRFHPKVVAEVVARQLASFNTTPEELVAFMRDAGYHQSRPLNPEKTDWEWTAQELGSLIRVADPSVTGQLIEGFHGLEQNTWRWTAKNFRVTLKPPAGADKVGARLMLHFIFPDVSLQKLKSMTVSAKIDGIELPSQTFTTSGDHEYRADVRIPPTNKGAVNVDFMLDKAIAPTQADPRELGVIVTSIGLETK